MSFDVKQVQSVFLAAVEINDPSRRSTMLDRRCGDDAELRKRVESLLRAHDEPDDLPPVLLGLRVPTDELPNQLSKCVVVTGRRRCENRLRHAHAPWPWVKTAMSSHRRFAPYQRASVWLR